MGRRWEDTRLRGGRGYSGQRNSVRHDEQQVDARSLQDDERKRGRIMQLEIDHLPVEVRM